MEPPFSSRSFLARYRSHRTEVAMDGTGSLHRYLSEISRSRGGSRSRLPHGWWAPPPRRVRPGSTRVRVPVLPLSDPSDRTGFGSGSIEGSPTSPWTPFFLRSARSDRDAGRPWLSRTHARHVLARVPPERGDPREHLPPHLQDRRLRGHQSQLGRAQGAKGDRRRRRPGADVRASARDGKGGRGKTVGSAREEGIRRIAAREAEADTRARTSAAANGRDQGFVRAIATRPRHSTRCFERWKRSCKVASEIEMGNVRLTTTSRVRVVSRPTGHAVQVLPREDGSGLERDQTRRGRGSEQAGARKDRFDAIRRDGERSAARETRLDERREEPGCPWEGMGSKETC